MMRPADRIYQTTYDRASASDRERDINSRLKFYFITGVQWPHHTYLATANSLMSILFGRGIGDLTLGPPVA